jgi:hypothetical protein
MQAARTLEQLKAQQLLSASDDEIKKASIKQSPTYVAALAAVNKPGGLAKPNDAYTAEPCKHHHFAAVYTPKEFTPPADGSPPLCDLLMVMARCAIHGDPNLIGTPYAVDAGALGASHRTTPLTDQLATLWVLTPSDPHNRDRWERLPERARHGGAVQVRQARVVELRAALAAIQSSSNIPRQPVGVDLL